MLMAASRGATVALGLMVSVVQLPVRVGRGVLQKGRAMGVILKTLRGVGIQVAKVMVRGISTLPNYSSRSLTISRVGMPSTPAFSIEKEATQLAKFTAALGSLF